MAINAAMWNKTEILRKNKKRKAIINLHKIFVNGEKLMPENYSRESNSQQKAQNKQSQNRQMQNNKNDKHASSQQKAQNQQSQQKCD